jgi:hypothetical protein
MFSGDYARHTKKVMEQSLELINKEVHGDVTGSLLG